MTEPTMIWTHAGLAAVLSAKNAGFKAAFTHIGAGCQSYLPRADQTRLRDEQQRVAIVDYEQLSATQIRLGAKFSGDQAYEVREIGIYLDSGILVAVYSAPDTLFTYKSAHSSWIQKLTLDISALPTDSVTITLGTENLNLMLTHELATLAQTHIAQMHRQLVMFQRLQQLENIVFKEKQ